MFNYEEKMNKINIFDERNDAIEDPATTYAIFRILKKRIDVTLTDDPEVDFYTMALRKNVKDTVKDMKPLISTIESLFEKNKIKFDDRTQYFDLVNWNRNALMYSYDDYNQGAGILFPFEFCTVDFDNIIVGATYEKDRAKDMNAKIKIEGNMLAVDDVLNKTVLYYPKNFAENIEIEIPIKEACFIELDNDRTIDVVGNNLYVDIATPQDVLLDFFKKYV